MERDSEDVFHEDGKARKGECTFPTRFCYKVMAVCRNQQRLQHSQYHSFAEYIGAMYKHMRVEENTPRRIAFLQMMWPKTKSIVWMMNMDPVATGTTHIWGTAGRWERPRRQTWRWARQIGEGFGRLNIGMLQKRQEIYHIYQDTLCEWNQISPVVPIVPLNWLIRSICSPKHRLDLCASSGELIVSFFASFYIIYT